MKLPWSKAEGNKKNGHVTDETEGVSDVDMTENRDIPDHPWPYMREMFEIVCVKKDSWRIVYFCIHVLI